MQTIYYNSKAGKWFDKATNSPVTKVCAGMMIDPDLSDGNWQIAVKSMGFKLIDIPWSEIKRIIK